LQGIVKLKTRLAVLGIYCRDSKKLGGCLRRILEAAENSWLLATACKITGHRADFQIDSSNEDLIGCK
jgi:hypothetical protein